LNAWLGGYQNMLKRMTVGNFNWFLHTMLFLHTERVIKRQVEQQKKDETGEVDSDSEDEIED
jgi:hypothetical protein